MPNRQYLAGRRFEYDTMRIWEARGFECIRASGSHGAYDVVAYRPNTKPVLVQCKRVEKLSTGQALIKSFIANTKPAQFYHQCIFVKIKGDTTPMEVSV